MTKNHWSKLKLNWKWTTCLFHVFSLTPADFYSCQLITLFHLINQAIVINWNVCMYAEWQMLHSERASGEPAVSSHALQSLFHFYRQINTNAEDFRTWILMQVIKHGFFFFSGRWLHARPWLGEAPWTESPPWVSCSCRHCMNIFLALDLSSQRGRKGRHKGHG